MQALRANEAGLKMDERLERLKLFGLSSPAILLILVILVIPVGWLFYVSFVGADGKLGGYSGDGGLETKTALLRLEGALL